MARYGEFGSRSGVVLNLAAAALLTAGSTSAALAKGTNYQILYAFTGGADGSEPHANLVRDGARNLYGTTFFGGGGNNGIVFELAPNGTESVLHSFSGGADGFYPGYGSLLRDGAGNLYGTTEEGGMSGAEAGTVFKVAPDGTKTELYSFCPGGYPCVDGETPAAGVIADGKGDLFGATLQGGPDGSGTIYEVRPDGTETVLYGFTGGADGGNPVADLKMIRGNIYGTASAGGDDGAGTVFELVKGKKGAFTFKLLYAFTGGTDGGYPCADLTADSAGNLYSTTTAGGAYGNGNVFKLAPDGTETVLYSFTGGNDGASPYAGLLIKSGTLYGMTSGGGDNGLGTIFALAQDGTETVLHAFAGGSDGQYPMSPGPMIERKGYLYGTTAQGGTNGAGIAFKVRY
jgi:uncharacterized repeat protein (TIGR03803 family)